MTKGDAFLRDQLRALRRLQAGPRYYATAQSRLIAMERSGWIERTGNGNAMRVEYRITDFGRRTLTENQRVGPSYDRNKEDQP